MARKTPSKASSLLMSIASVYTAIPMLEKIDRTGGKTETFEARALDLGATTYGAEFIQNGYSTPPKITASGFYDPLNSVHAAVLLKSWTPEASTPWTTNFKITWNATSPLSEIWAVSGVGVDLGADSPKGLALKLDLQCTGDPS